jgi:integrase
MAKKRGNNEGSIYPFRGRWAAAVTLPGGRRKVMYGRSRDDVRRLLAEALAARESGTLTHARGMTLGAFLDLFSQP